MKRRPEDFAVNGGRPLFEDPVPFGQLYFPSWERYENDMRALWARGWYTNHGPLLQLFEERLADFFGVRHAIVSTNEAIALSILLKASGIRGRVVLPAFCSVGTARAVTWAGLEPVFADVDPLTHHVSRRTLRDALESAGDDHGPPVSGAVFANLWGTAAPRDELEEVTRAHGLTVLYDSAHGAGTEVTPGIRLGRFGGAEVFSFHASNVLSCAEGAAVTTDDDDIADRYRNMRCGYGIPRRVPVPTTSNGRASEAQALLGLAALDSFDEHVTHNHAVHLAYTDSLHDVPGVTLLEGRGVHRSNGSYVVAMVDAAQYGMTADELARVLHAEGVGVGRYFGPGAHHLPPYVQDPTHRRPLAGADEVSANVVQLPVGGRTAGPVAQMIAELVACASRHAPALRRQLDDASANPGK
ncbi:MAG TPA: aminotransferase class I/II-fold pyridoxal phosphate-dependent enzyme [Acidimicrobiales bacterium]|nr:aminotransferase class I/II-fold pyridoxal phosphate-dependent enzyme [Acidimicrobiales bacterium]